jgi:hypothetical protein
VRGPPRRSQGGSAGEITPMQGTQANYFTDDLKCPVVPDPALL